MIEQRTMQKPGEGIVPPEQAATQHQEYPKHMVHDGYQPGQLGEVIKFGDQDRPAFTYRAPGTAIRFPPVLVLNEQQEEYHKAQGYRSIGKSDPAAFARAVATAAPQVLDYKPVEYPKMVAGKTVNNAAEEAAALGLPPPAPPVVELAEKSDDLEIAELELKLAEARASKAERIARLKAELAAELGESEPAKAEPPAPSSEVAGTPAVDTEVNTLEVWPAPPLYPPAPPAVAFREETEPKLTPQQKRAATLARKKAERENATEPVQNSQR